MQARYMNVMPKQITSAMREKKSNEKHSIFFCRALHSTPLTRLFYRLVTQFFLRNVIEKGRVASYTREYRGGCYA